MLDEVMNVLNQSEALTRDQAIEVLNAHEWQYQEDLKHVMCPTCGARFKEKTKNKHHRKGCGWVKVTILVAYALSIQGRLT